MNVDFGCYDVLPVETGGVSHRFAAPLAPTETRLRATGVDFSPSFTRKFADLCTLAGAQSKAKQVITAVLSFKSSFIHLLSRVGERLTIAKTIASHFLFNIIDIIGKLKLIRGVLNAFDAFAVVDHSRIKLA